MFIYNGHSKNVYNLDLNPIIGTCNMVITFIILYHPTEKW